MNFRALKLAVVLTAIVLTSLAYSDLLRPGDYVLTTAIGITLLGIFLSGGSASGTVFLSTVLYVVPYSIGISQFLPVAFPQAYNNLSGGAILASPPYFSSPLGIFTLMALSILAEYIETTERWEKVLRGGSDGGKGGAERPCSTAFRLLCWRSSFRWDSYGSGGESQHFSNRDPLAGSHSPSRHSRGVFLNRGRELPARHRCGRGSPP